MGVKMEGIWSQASSVQREGVGKDRAEVETGRKDGRKEKSAWMRGGAARECVDGVDT